jgi:hypothetical protein
MGEKLANYTFSRDSFPEYTKNLKQLSEKK